MASASNSLAVWFDASYQLPVALGALFAFAIGACIGSFLNVIAYRLPRELSIVVPGSACPNCARAIPLWANVPIIAYFALRGRCINCHAAIALRYPLTELGMGLCALYLYFTFPPLGAVVRFALCSALLIVGIIDNDWGIIPDAITVPGIVFGFLTALWLMPGAGWKISALGIFIGAGVLLAIGLLYRLVRHREGVGLGDVKLVAMIGAFLGLPGVLFTLLGGSLLGAGCGILIALMAHHDPQGFKAEGVAPRLSPAEHASTTQEIPAGRPGLLETAIPFGPFLSFAAGIYTLFEPQLTRWYFPN